MKKILSRTRDYCSFAVLTGAQKILPVAGWQYRMIVRIDKRVMIILIPCGCATVTADNSLMLKDSHCSRPEWEG